MSQFAIRAGGVPGLNPLRVIGPKVFISYSFTDHQIAADLQADLVASGFQVTMEDDTSLLNEKLPEVLAARIERVECFVQLRTTAANKSTWVTEELAIAERKRLADERFVILPIVFDTETLDERAAKWVYVDASTGLTPAALSLVRSVLLKSVTRVRTKCGQPSALDETDVEGALIDAHFKRVIIDADGFWLDLLDEVLRFSRILLRTAKHPFLEQEEERRRRLVWSLARVDASAKSLLQRLRANMQQGVIDRRAAGHAFQVFYRIIFEHYFWPIVQNAERAHCFSFDDDVEGLSRLGEGNTQDTESAAMTWALRPALEDRARLAPGASTDLIKTGLDSAEFHGAYVYFPRSALTENWPVRVAPQEIVMRRDWAMFALPQVAARAVGLTQRHNPDFYTEAFEEIESKTGWNLTDYRLIGPP